MAFLASRYNDCEALLNSDVRVVCFTGFKRIKKDLSVNSPGGDISRVGCSPFESLISDRMGIRRSVSSLADLNSASMSSVFCHILGRPSVSFVNLSSKLELATSGGRIRFA